jgi:hypothetical protein
MQVALVSSAAAPLHDARWAPILAPTQVQLSTRPF